MINSSAFRIALGKGDVSIWSFAVFFGQSEPSTLRDFLSCAFAVPEVDGVELRRATSFGRIHYGAVANPGRIWKKLSQALSAREPLAPYSGKTEEPARRIDAGLVYLDSPSCDAGSHQPHRRRVVDVARARAERRYASPRAPRPAPST